MKPQGLLPPLSSASIAWSRIDPSTFGGSRDSGRDDPCTCSEPNHIAIEVWFEGLGAGENRNVSGLLIDFGHAERSNRVLLEASLDKDVEISCIMQQSFVGPRVDGDIDEACTAEDGLDSLGIG